MFNPTIRSILVASDLSPAADELLRAAGELAEHAQAELHVVTAIDVTGFWERATSGKLDEEREAERQECERALQAQLRRVFPEPRTASQTVVMDAPHRAILQRAGEVGAELIVLGAHRGGAVSAHFLGTTADRVLRTAEVPCLVARGPLRLPMHRIGVPLDFSDPSRGALELAFLWADAFAAGTHDVTLHVMHVGWPVYRADNPNFEEEVVRPELQAQVAAVAEHSGEVRPRVEVDVIWANEPIAATLDWIEAADVDLVVAGTHGHGGLKRALIGSVSSALARQTPCPVLLVPPRFWHGSAGA